MADENFTHDSAHFEKVEQPAGVRLDAGEARYAELVAEVLWDGVLTDEKRQRLKTAVGVFGLEPARAAQIEQSITVAHEARHQVAVIDRTTAASEAVDEEPAPKSEGRPKRPTLRPIAPSVEPVRRALEKRIAVLEGDNRALTNNVDSLRKHNEQLEELVAQLQFALESSLDELAETHAKLDGLGASHDTQLPHEPDVDDAPASQLQPVPPPRASMERATETAPDARASQTMAIIDPAERLAEERIAIANVGISVRRSDPAALHDKVGRAPRDVATLHALYHALGRGADLDRRVCVAQVLQFLGAASADQLALLDTHARPGLVRPKRALNDDEWAELLCHPGQDRLTGRILAEIAPAVLLGHVTALRASIAPEVVEPDQKVDPEFSEVPAVRCMAWAAATLGLETPAIYTDAFCPVMADVVFTPTPATRIGSRALRGRSARQLAFVAGRHLSWYRPEHVLGVPSKSIGHLELLFLTALTLGNPGFEMDPDAKERVEPIARMVKPLLEEDALDRLRLHFARFVELGAASNVARWLDAVETTACCAGLLLSADLAAAASVLELDEPDLADVRVDQLIVFATSARYSELRRRIGVVAGG